VALDRNSAQPELVDRPAGQVLQCEYNIRFPSTTGNLRLQDGATTRLRNNSNRNRMASAVYFTSTQTGSATTFTPTATITLTVSDFPLNRSRLDGTEFRVTYTRVANADRGCTRVATTVITVGNSLNPSTTSSATLVDRPAGVSTRCQYDVDFPIFLDPGLNIKVSGTPTGETVNGGSASSAATYVEAPSAERNTFRPHIAFTVPQVDADGNGNNDFSGQIIRLLFRRTGGSDRNCSAGQQDMRIANNGTVVSQRDIRSLIAHPPGAPGECEYTVNYQVIGTGAGSTSLGRVALVGSTGTYRVSGRSPVIAAEFTSRTVFTTSVALTVPQTQDNPEGVNDHSGQRFTFSLRRTGGPSGGCSSSFSAVYEVADDGSVALAEGSLALTDRPAGWLTRCIYELAIPPRVGDLALSGGRGRTVFAESVNVVGTYFALTTSFVPSVTISVPQINDDGNTANDYTGTEFDVVFTRVEGANADCTETATTTVTVGDDGSSEVTTEAMLVNRPARVDARCEYDVAFPAMVANTVGDLTLQPGSTTGVQGTIRTATATYFGPTSNFAPAIDITVPQINDDGNTANDYSGTEFDVVFTRVEGANAGCNWM